MNSDVAMFPIPQDEEQRLKLLESYGILDTPSEEAFDRISGLAARLFDVPIALVSLVDRDRQFFKSCYGLNVRETAREVSFCTHTIVNDQPLIVPDAFEDERFAESPLVTGPPYVRFYAGIPLMQGEYSAIGSFCLVDHVPRNLSDEEIRNLSDLAKMVEDELHLHEKRNTERELLEKTLVGSIGALTEMLALYDQEVFGRAEKLRRSVRMFLERFQERYEFPYVWELETAAILSQIGYVALPEKLVEKDKRGDPLSPRERGLLNDVSEIGYDLLKKIPRLEKVAYIVRMHGNSSFEQDPCTNDELLGEGAVILSSLARRLDLEESGTSGNQICDVLEKEFGSQFPRVWETLTTDIELASGASASSPDDVVEVDVDGIKVGDILRSGVVATDDTLIMSEGAEVTSLVKKRLQNFAELYNIREPILVLR